MIILWTRKGGIGRQKIAKVGERIFGADYRSGCLRKYGCENK